MGQVRELEVGQDGFGGYRSRERRVTKGSLARTRGEGWAMVAVVGVGQEGWGASGNAGCVSGGSWAAQSKGQEVGTG